MVVKLTIPVSIKKWLSSLTLCALNNLLAQCPIMLSKICCNLGKMTAVCIVQLS